MRSACLGPADVLVVMDVVELTFTIHDLDEVDGPGAVVLCATHIGRLRAPVGWDLVDLRGAGSVILMPERPMTVGEAADMADEVLRPVADVEPIRPTARPDAAVHPLEAARTAARTAARSAARSATGVPDVVDEELVPDTAETPLLARAFLGVERHPSAGPDDIPSDPFEGDHWDQSDERASELEGQLTLGGDPAA